MTPGSTPGDCWLVDSVGDFSPTFDRDEGSSFLYLAVRSESFDLSILLVLTLFTVLRVNR